MPPTEAATAVEGQAPKVLRGAHNRTTQYDSTHGNQERGLSRFVLELIAAPPSAIARVAAESEPSRVPCRAHSRTTHHNCGLSANAQAPLTFVMLAAASTLFRGPRRSRGRRFQSF